MLERDQRNIAYVRAVLRMAYVTIFCSRTGSNVQVWVANAQPGESADSYDAVTCPGCGLLHFVNKTTGKALGGAARPRLSAHDSDRQNHKGEN